MVAAKLTYTVAIIIDGVIALAPVVFFVRFMTKHDSIWSKALMMPLTIWNCVLSYQHVGIIAVTIGIHVFCYGR